MPDLPQKEVRELLDLQGEIRMAFIAAGVDERRSLDLAAEALHVVAKSPVATEEHRAAYEALSHA